MGIYILSAIGLLIKIYIFFASRKIENKTFFYSMLAFFAIHNLCELLGFVAMMNGHVPLALLKAYYCATFFALTWMVNYSILVSEIKKLKMLINPLIVVCVAVSGITFGTDYIVQGVINIGYTGTAEKGQYYIVFPVFVVSALLLTLSTLLTAIKLAVTDDSRINSFIVLLALSPLIICSFILVPIMVLGLKLNASGIVPICTTAFLFIVMKSESIHLMTDIRRWLPFSDERKLAQEFVRLSSELSAERMDYKTFSVEIERLSLEYKYNKSNKNITRMSKMMGLHRTTVYSMMRRHDFRDEKEKLVD